MTDPQASAFRGPQRNGGEVIKIKIRVDDVRGQRVRMTVFAGESNYANCGQICMRDVEAAVFVSALQTGQKYSGNFFEFGREGA